MRHARILAASSLLTLALAVGGCSAATTATTTAPAASTSTSTSAPSGTVDKAALLEKVKAGAAATKTYTMDSETAITMAGNELKTKMSGSIDQTDPKNLKGSFTMSLGTGDISMVMNGDDYYMKMGGKWYKTSRSKLSESGASVPGDQSAALADMGDSIKSITEEGTETLDGVQTTHYSMVLDASALSKLGGGTSTGLSGDMPYEVWIDADGKVRKFDMEIKDKVTMTATITNINEPVTINVPTDATTLPGS